MWPAWATVGRQSSDACAIWSIFLCYSLDVILIGAGAVLTTAFVKDARSFILNEPAPAASSQVVETCIGTKLTRAINLRLARGALRGPHGENSLSASIPHRPTKRSRRFVPRI